MKELEVSIRDLRNHGGDVVERATAGERLIVTRAGKPVAEIRPLPNPPLSATVVLDHWSRLPVVDPYRLREDVDSVVDPTL